jgi:hypothetical protein
MIDVLIVLVALLACVIGLGGLVAIATVVAGMAVDAYHARPPAFLRCRAHNGSYRCQLWRWHLRAHRFDQVWWIR